MIREEYQINVDDIVNRYLPYEQILEMDIDSDENNEISSIRLSIKRIFDIRNNDNATFLRRVLRDKNLSTYSSLNYYLAKEEKDFQIFRSSGKNKIILDNYKSTVNLLLCSIYNSLMEILESCYLNKRPNIIYYLLAFEACPCGMPLIDSRTEVLNIKKIFVSPTEVLCLPVIRFGTNANIFKNTCNKYSVDFLHFAGHGEGNGDLAFVGKDNRVKFLGFKAFDDFFANKYVHSSKKIKLAYFNSCFSSKYVKHMVESNLIPHVFRNAISFNGINYDCFAIDFSKLLYSDLCSNLPETFDAFKNTKEKYMSSKDQRKVEYSKNVQFD